MRLTDPDAMCTFLSDYEMAWRHRRNKQVKFSNRRHK
jgi:hypothetical protein